MLDLSPPRAARVAYAAAALNLAAAVTMWSTLRAGLRTPGSEPFHRLEYIRGHTTLWQAGWLVWHAAAIALVLLFLVLARRFAGHAPVRAAVASIAALAGLSADLVAEAISMGVAPALSVQDFLLAESIVEVLTGYLGNGLYTVAGILLTWAGWRQLPRAILALSPIVWGAGVCLSLSSLAHWPAGELWSTAVLMPAFVLWAALVGRWVARLAS
jgi:hypothetical protein